MLGMAGFPLTGGMFGKLFVFSAAYDAGDWWLVLVGVAATAISLGYYLNVVRWLYMRSAVGGAGLVAVGGVVPAATRRRHRSRPAWPSRSVRSSSPSPFSTCDRRRRSQPFSCARTGIAGS
jgi:hypothetical protein